MSTVNPALSQTNYSYYKIPVLFTPTATYSTHRASVKFTAAATDSSTDRSFYSLLYSLLYNRYTRYTHRIIFIH